jgi:hypothetical protein
MSRDNLIKNGEDVMKRGTATAGNQMNVFSVYSIQNK